MKYRALGNTGLIVSGVAAGTMQFGSKMNEGNLNQEYTTRMVKLALDQGINLIETGDVDSLGESEALLANALKGVRNEVVFGARWPVVFCPASTVAPIPRPSEPALGTPDSL